MLMQSKKGRGRKGVSCEIISLKIETVFDYFKLERKASDCEL